MALERRGRVLGRQARPAEPGSGHLSEIECFARPDDDGVVFRTNFEHKAGATIRARNSKVQPLALADREGRGTLVLADDIARAVQDLTLLCTHPIGEPAAGVTVRDEADVVAVRLVCDTEAALGGLGTHLGFRRRLGQREHAVRELFGGEHTQHV